MPKQNTFLAVAMKNADLVQYYPGNDQFRHFTFQQVMEDGTKQNDEYILTAYAVDMNNEIMGDQIELVELEGTDPYLAPKRVQFANLIATRSDLNTIFSNSTPVNDLCMYPQKCHNYPKYVAYKMSDAASLAKSKVIEPYN